MNQIQARHKRTTIIFLILALLLLLVILMAVGGQQISLPITGIQSHRQAMPPDPEDWCDKVNLDKLNQEITKAETFFEHNVGEHLVNWRYLRQALRYTGVQVNGPEDSYWLNMIKNLYAGCSP